jgi:penicillin amidase
MLARVFGSAAPARTFPALTAANLPPMRGPVRILRDANGVGHVYADDERDRYAAAGWLQAADRFFFLDVIRHLGAGRLCGLLGNLKAPKGLGLGGGGRLADLDGFVRPLGFEAQSRTDATRLSPRAAAVLDAFADGVNAALHAMRGSYPPEYLLTSAPRTWQPADCLLNGRACAFVVSLTGFENERAFDAVRGEYGDGLARRLYPEAPWENVPTSYRVGGGEETPEAPLGTVAAGSNNWAVSAAHSASGAPLVANDPHVPFVPLPTFWHHLHLHGPDYRVQGGMFPGFPGFGFGHNGALAWGCTTGFRDAFDVYRVHRLADDPSRYRTEHGSGAITKHREELPARRRSVTLQWESCDHGVLYPDWHHHDGTPLAVRMVPTDMAALAEGYLDIAAAQTVEAFRAGLARLNDGPFDFNLVYGHRDGAIGWELFGRAPQRRGGDGLFVRDAHDPAGQWDGWVPFEAMPKQRDPARGFVATANSMTDPVQCAVAFTATHCEPRYRTEQIEARLTARATHDADSVAAIQRDVTGDYAAAQRDALLAAIGAVQGNDVARRAIAVLRAWDGTFASESAGAALYALIQQDLPQRLFRPLLGAKLGPRFANGRRAMPRMHRLLLDAGDPLRADLERAAGQSIETLVRESFFAVVERLAAAQGRDPVAWRWGAVQRVWLGTPFGLLPLIGRRFVALEADFPGDEYTINPSRSIPLRGRHYAFVGATSRFICDLATPDQALFAHSAGPSADPNGPFFRTGAEQWQRFEYFRSALWEAEAVPNVVERLES